MLALDVEQRVLRVLREATDSDEVLVEPDLPLYASGLLDSLGTVTLIAALDQEFDLEISPAEFDPAAWSTPARLVRDIERRLAAQRAEGGR